MNDVNDDYDDSTDTWRYVSVVLLCIYLDVREKGRVSLNSVTRRVFSEEERTLFFLSTESSARPRRFPLFTDRAPPLDLSEQCPTTIKLIRRTSYVDLGFLLGFIPKPPAVVPIGNRFSHFHGNCHLAGIEIQIRFVGITRELDTGLPGVNRSSFRVRGAIA